MKAISTRAFVGMVVFLLNVQVAFSATLNEIINQLNKSSPSGAVKVSSGLEISDGVVLTVSHALEKVNDLPFVDPFESNSTSKQNPQGIERLEQYPIIGKSRFPQAVSILSNDIDAFILRKASSDSDSYSAVPVFKNFFMDPNDQLSHDPVRILLESENAVLSEKAKRFFLDWDGIWVDQGIQPPTSILVHDPFLLKFAFPESDLQQFVRFSWFINGPSVFSNWKTRNMMLISGPSLHIGGGMSGGGVFIRYRGKYKLMGLLCGYVTENFALDHFINDPEFEKALIQNGAKKNDEVIVKENAIGIKEVNFNQISEAIQNCKAQHLKIPLYQVRSRL
jgi:hypothetical protein